MVYNTRGVPSPEVTVLFCLVPSPSSSSALVFSTCPPASLFLVRFSVSYSSFSWKQGINGFSTHRSVRTTCHLSIMINGIRPRLPAYMTVPEDNQRLAHLGFSVPHITTYKKSRNINLVPIDYAFQPRLRGRLTLLRLNVVQETWDFRREGFYLFYSCQHSQFRLQETSHFTFIVGLQNAPLPPQLKCTSAASVNDFRPRYIFRAGAARLVSITLSLKDGCF